MLAMVRLVGDTGESIDRACNLHKRHRRIEMLTSAGPDVLYTQSGQRTIHPRRAGFSRT